MVAKWNGNSRESKVELTPGYMRIPSWLFELFARKPPFWTRLPFDLLALIFFAFLDVPMDAGADLELGVRLGFEETPLSFPSCEDDFERVTDLRSMYTTNHTYLFWRDPPAAKRAKRTPPPPPVAC